MSKIRTAAVAGIVALAIAGSAALATTGASASPSPGPAFNPRLQQQEIDLSLVNQAPVTRFGLPVTFDSVRADGPLRFLGSDDLTRETPFSDTIGDGLGNNVTILHRNIQPTDVTIDLGTCSINVVQTDVRWLIVRGEGRFRFVRGSGIYDASGQWSFPTFRNICTLNPLLTPAVAARSLNNGGIGLPRVLQSFFGVQATGTASLFRFRI